MTAPRLFEGIGATARRVRELVERLDAVADPRALDIAAGV